MAMPAIPRLPAALPRAGVSGEARAALRQLQEDHARTLAGAFRGGAPAIELARQRAACIERILVHCWTACLGETRDAALFAVGGFGRGALFPHSDVDLLVLAEGEGDTTLVSGHTDSDGVADFILTVQGRQSLNADSFTL